MTNRILAFVSIFGLTFPVLAAEPVAATVESSLASAGGRIRQFAFDADPSTYFVSDTKPKKGDRFTLTFDKPVEIQSLTILADRPKGDDAITASVLEVSTERLGARLTERG